MTSPTVSIEGGRFAITGGLSLLAEHISDQLLRAGASEIVLLDNLAFHPDGGPARSNHDRVRLVRADVRDLDAVSGAFTGTDGVFHTAAFVTLPLARDPLLGLDVNIRGTGTVLEAAAATGVQKVVLSSSVAVYGESAESPIGEESPFRISGLQPAAVMYGASKLAAEALGQKVLRDHHLPVVSLRYSSLYGQSQKGRGLNAMHLWEALEQMLAGQVPTLGADPAEMHDYLHASDAARANLAAMEADIASGSYNIATGRARRLDDAVRVLADLVGRDGGARYDPQARRVRFSTSTSLDYDIDAARRDLGWEAQVTLEQGLALLVNSTPHQKDQ